MISSINLPRGTSRQARLIGICLLVWAALAWFVTVRVAGVNDGLMSLEMMSMHAMSFGDAIAFLVMWVAMMGAMMLPVVTPTVMAHHTVRTKQGDGSLSTVMFASGYLTVWWAIGLFPLALFLALPSLVARVGIPPLLVGGGALLVAGGLYQLTPWKEACLRHCRHPLDFLMTHDFSGGLTSTYRAGVVHGLYCLGCCWALMLVVLGVGMTNLIWMAVIGTIFAAERWSRWGDRLDRILAPALLATGAWVMLQAL